MGGSALPSYGAPAAPLLSRSSPSPCVAPLLPATAAEAAPAAPAGSPTPSGSADDLAAGDARGDVAASRAGCGSPTRSRPAPCGGRTYDVGRWTSPWVEPGLRPHRADRRRGRPRRRAGLGPGPGPRPDRRWPAVELGHARPLGRRRPRIRAHHRSTARPTTWPTSTSTPGRRRRASRPSSCGSACCASGRQRRRAVAVASARWPPGCPTSPGRHLRDPGDAALGSRARRAALLADGALAATTRRGAAAARPGARRRRPRWCSATTTRCPAPRRTPGCPTATRPLGRPRGPDDLRPRLRRHRQLAVQHGVRRRPHRPARRS